MEKDNDTYMINAVNAYADLIYRIAFQNLGNRSDAEDTVQEVFIKLLKAPSFQDDTHMKAWLIRITINLCKDLKKSAWHRKTTSLIENSSCCTQEQQEIMDEIWRLPVKYRNVIYLYYYEEYTISEISEILNVRKNTVNSWLVRARKNLKGILISGGFQDD